MPILNISLTGEANTSATGMVTDPTVLKQIAAVIRHLSDRAQTDKPPTPES